MTVEGTQPRLNGDKKPRARKDGGQEQTIKLKVVKDKIEELENLGRAANDASEQYSDAVKKVAEESGLNAKAVRSFVAARLSEKFEERKREVQQLEMLFDQVGE